MKKITLLCLMLVLYAVSALALPVNITEADIDHVELLPNALNRLDIARSDEFQVQLQLISPQDLQDVEVQAFISGFEFNDLADERLSDATALFDMRANTTYVKQLSLRLSDNVDVDNYKLRVIISDRDSTELIQSYNLFIDAPRHAVSIDDLLLTPHSKVKAGSALLATVRVRNNGQRQEDNVKVTVRLPQLGLAASDFIDEIQADDEEETQELFMRIPLCADAGVYDFEAVAQFDDRHRTTAVQRLPITVLANPLCEMMMPDKDAPANPISIVLGSQLESAKPETSAIFPVTLTNAGVQTRSFTLTASTPENFGARVSPTSTVVLQHGQSATLYLFVTPTAGVPTGTQVITATITSGSDALAQAAFTINVLEGDAGWMGTLQVLFMLLLILLVILAVVAGIGRLRVGRGNGSRRSYY